MSPPIQMNYPAETLAELSRWLGDEARRMTILGEGNTSATLGTDTFLVKASGSNLGTLTPSDLVECRAAPLLELISHDHVSDDDVDSALLRCRQNPEAKRPSVEALFHAYLLSLPGIRFVGHTHPDSVTSILCPGALRGSGGLAGSKNTGMHRGLHSRPPGTAASHSFTQPRSDHAWTHPGIGQSSNADDHQVSRYFHGCKILRRAEFPHGSHHSKDRGPP